jgi:hypothetical protein
VSYFHFHLFLQLEGKNGLNACVQVKEQIIVLVKKKSVILKATEVHGVLGWVYGHVLFTNVSRK